MTSNPMRDWMRRGRVLLVVVALLLGAAAGAAWVLFHLYGPDRIRTELEHALSTASGRPARVEAVTFRPWLGTLRVSGVRVANDGPAAGGAILSLDHADIGIRLESLWRRQLVLTVTLAGLDVTTSATGGGGEAGLVGLALPSTFSLGSVEVRIGSDPPRPGPHPAPRSGRRMGGGGPWARGRRVARALRAPAFGARGEPPNRVARGRGAYRAASRRGERAAG